MCYLCLCYVGMLEGGRGVRLDERDSVNVFRTGREGWMHDCLPLFLVLVAIGGCVFFFAEKCVYLCITYRIFLL